ncbi:RNA-directed DNA polymerase [Komagataeibacter europaeus]|uniref:RNA-directed DNA polymerase n=1 Tax=Komagataeibacter europaeus TaxID=33995 RepID=UPI000312B583|nr:RNA-directed DNA polymerase [Komagataeibacter europaeus]
MSDLEAVFNLENLRRAYRWTMSNPDAQYKSYFRDSYDAFAIASDTHLKWIRQEGLKERYQVSHASKLLLPKPSGTLRPITLLTVEDQIVYQACVNLIADALKRKTRHRYEKRVFAHLYAGKSSPFFYLQWQRSYKKFANKIEKAFNDGHRFIANFDLTAFYDSIDHHVLRHFLVALEMDEDTVDFLLRCLKVWTSSTWSNGQENIYHEHGIPQGPLASGMLSEAVLQHIDAAGERGSKTVYLRYVDDIKILAKNEGELRRKLIALDIASKEIGLFPQTAKINIRKITNPRDEVKSVSRPPEPAIKPTVDQKKLVSRLLEMTRNSRVSSENVTRFRYLLAHASPSHRLNVRLMAVLYRQPEHAPAICRYIAAYAKIPDLLSKEIENYISTNELYHAVNAQLLRSCLGKCPPAVTASLGRICADRLLRPRLGVIQLQPSYKEALIGWTLSAKTITFAEYDGVLAKEKDWWVKKCAFRELTYDLFGEAIYADFVNRQMRDAGSEVARIAAGRLIGGNLKLVKPYGNVETTAKHILKAARVIRSVGQPNSRINEILAYILKRRKTAYDWKVFFGGTHDHAERMMIFLKRNRESNIDAFLVQLDSWCDEVFSHIYARLKSGKQRPNYGVALRDSTLLPHLPRLMPYFLRLHDLRLESTTAHPRSHRSGAATRRLKHRDFYAIRNDLILAFDELEANIVP